ncbi:TIGR03564 family F420-dependent LLM class oxidoreductase [Actinocorallia sp. A-T 12471]|uniref:TIGR03564 family F420-dependent LLM class oxidoreductase n=1 Tax=Actinocorallia sp. A-T 12471 TaxID=3089813 RepID=UPI0029CF1009|nr:TIGR03564 family F420-dependent LLM class oxidoreductase [Actinocorallia sp. A-T 12471]MDX6741060.1 TIGR03564 family F420-dependent LLM class oxidoreductase [Actinocorallia sp. A-T 12471]
MVIPVTGTANAVDTAVERARAAAEAGVRSVWLSQQFAYDAIALAGIIGREVPGVTVGTSAVPVFGRHPLLVGAQAQTSQAATGGRFALGLGLGAQVFVEKVFGTPYERPIARLREFLTALRAYLETGESDFEGEILTARTPLPSALAGASPTVPVYVAAMGPQALRVTGELADGTLPFLAGPKALSEHIVPALAAAADDAGRPAPRVIAFIPAVVTDKVEETREAAARQTGFYDTIPSYQRVLAWSGVSKAADLVEIGDEDAIAAAIARYRSAGATDIVLTQTDLAGPESTARTLDLLGSLTS